MVDDLFPTTVIGSYPKPKWLNRVRELNKKDEFPEEYLRESEDDAAKVILNEHERAGVQVITDGEMRREEMVEFFADKIPGYEFHGPVRVWGNNYFNKPSVTEELKQPNPMLVDEFRFNKRFSSENSVIKVPITGPYTIAEWSFNEVYSSKRELIFRLAEIINEEIKRLDDAGARCIQIDEPALSTNPDEVGLVKEAIEEVVKEVDIEKSILHACYGKFSEIYPEILEFDVDQFALEFANNDFKYIDALKEYDFTKELGLGCIDVHVNEVEDIEVIKDNIRRGFEVVDPEDLWINPDCGLKLLPRKTAYKKLLNMVKATDSLRKEF